MKAQKSNAQALSSQIKEDPKEDLTSVSNDSNHSSDLDIKYLTKKMARSKLPDPDFAEYCDKYSEQSERL